MVVVVFLAGNGSKLNLMITIRISVMVSIGFLFFPTGYKLIKNWLVAL